MRVQKHDLHLSKHAFCLEFSNSKPPPRHEQISRGDATDSIDDSPACACATGVCEGSNSNSSTDEASYGASLQCSRSQEKIAWVLRHGIPTQFRIENA
jgi:hypothetical protein